MVLRNLDYPLLFICETLVQVLRTFGHNDGYGTTMPVRIPIQPQVGDFSEAALQRYDYVMNALAEV